MVRDWLDDQGLRTVQGEKAPGNRVATTAYGWFVYADEEPAGQDFQADVIACLKKPRELGAAYILFDADAVQRADLPI